MEEVWKKVVGYESFYEVSSYGNVRSMDRLIQPKDQIRKGVVLSTFIDSTSSGYRFVNLSSNGKAKKKSVHSLVLEAFLGLRPAPDFHAMHIDGDRTNPRLENLKWGTQSENAKDKLKHGTHARGERSGRAKLTSQLVDWIKESHQSSKVLSKILDVSSSTIRAVRCGVNWSYSQEPK